MPIRCKMILNEKRNSMYPNYNGKPTCSVVFNAVGGAENKQWAKATPSGKIELTIDNPDAYEAFTLGKEYYVDFTESM